MSWFLLTKRAGFEAAHRLPNHDGKCARLHGHSWHVEVEIGKATLYEKGPKSGMAVDFGDISGPLRELVEARLDHYHLNESTGLENPTSEELAVWIYECLEEKYRRHDAELVAVTVEETCTSRARYEP